MEGDIASKRLDQEESVGVNQELSQRLWKVLVWSRMTGEVRWKVLEASSWTACMRQKVP